MVIFLFKPYEIEINFVPCYTDYSAVNITQYELVYLEQSEYRCSSIAGIKGKHNGSVIRTAVVGANVGGTGIDELYWL